MVTILCYDTPIKTTRTVYPEDPMHVKAVIGLGESIRRTITVREELEPAIKSKKDRAACAHVGTFMQQLADDLGIELEEM